MSKDPLETAIELVKMGKQADAMPILTMLIRNDPHDEKAWVWLIQAVPQNQRQQAAEMFFKDNPDSEMAKKALQSVGRQTLNKISTSPVSAVEKKRPAVFEEEIPESKVDELTAMIREEGNILPESAPDLVVVKKPDRVIQKIKLKPLWIIGSGIVVILVLGFILIEKGFFSGLSFLGFAPSNQPNIQTQFSAARTEAPLRTTTPILIPSYAPGAQETPTAGFATLSTPLATLVDAQLINQENALNLKIISRAPAPQLKALISPGLRYILPVTGSSEIRLLDFNSHETIFRAYLPADSLALAAFSPDEAYLAAGVNHGDIIIYDIKAGKSIRTIQTGSFVLVRTGSMTFSGDGHILAVISSGQYNIWNVDTGELLGAGSSANAAMAVSSQMLFLSCASYVCAEDIATGNQIRHFDANGTLPIFALSKDGAQIVVTSKSPDDLEDVKIFNTADGSTLATINTPLTVVWGLAFAPDGHILAAWGVNNTDGQYALVVMAVDKVIPLVTIDIGPYQENSGLEAQNLAYIPDGTGIIALTSTEAMIFATQ